MNKIFTGIAPKQKPRAIVPIEKVWGLLWNCMNAAGHPMTLFGTKKRLEGQLNST
jgi:hypothetical protein